MNATMNLTERPVIVLVERGCTGSHDPALRDVARVAGGRRVHLVAPAGPVAGERWLVDVGARERDAQARLDGWAAALAPHAASIDGEIGDENPRLAVADARRALGADARLVSISAPAASPAPPAPAATRPGRFAWRLASRVPA